MDLTSTFGVEGVLVEEIRTACVMGHVEAIREKLVVNVDRRFLQRDDMPPACNLFFEGIFFSTSGPRIPVVDAETLLHRRTIRQIFVEAVRVRRCIVSPF